MWKVTMNLLINILLWNHWNRLSQKPTMLQSSKPLHHRQEHSQDPFKAKLSHQHQGLNKLPRWPRNQPVLLPDTLLIIITIRYDHLQALLNFFNQMFKVVRRHLIIKYENPLSNSHNLVVDPAHQIMGDSQYGQPG